MGERYTCSEVHAFLSVIGAPRNLRLHYNIAPTDPVDVLRLGANGRELVTMRWRLMPFFWKKALKEFPTTFNARVETVHEKPMFRKAFLEAPLRHPRLGIYEWTGEKGNKQPHIFAAADGSPVLAFAGLWDQWKDLATGAAMLSHTMIVSGASEWMEAYHDRMPVLLDEKDLDAWLNGTIGVNDLQPASKVLCTHGRSRAPEQDRSRRR